MAAIKSQTKTNLVTYNLDPSIYYYDQNAGERPCRFFPKFLHHVKGMMANKPYEPMPWIQDRFLKPVFGLKRREDDLRLIRTVYIQLSRKNDKTTSIAGTGLYLLGGENEPGAEIYAAAADKDQARILFNIAKTMVSKNKRLSEGFKVYKDAIERPKTDSFFKVISSDAKTKHGFNAHAVLCDELHSWPKEELFDVLDTSTASRLQPLTIIITTPGYNKDSVCYKKYLYSKKIINGEIIDPTFYPIIFETGPDEDEFNEDVWRKANPGYGLSLRPDFIKAKAYRAKVEPSFLNTFRRLHLGRWVDSLTTWIDKNDWNKCSGKTYTLEELAGRTCWVGADIAANEDMVSVVAVFPDGKGNIDILAKHWVTEKAANSRKKKNDGIDYYHWIEKGYVDLVDGNAYDPDMIVNYIQQINEKCKVVSVGLDDWNATYIALQLVSIGVNVGRWRPNNWGLWSEPTAKLESMVMAKKINNMGNPVLAWNVENVVIKYMNGKIHKNVDDEDESDELDFKKDDYKRPDKSKSKDKIDGVIATIVAIGEYLRNPNVVTEFRGEWLD